MPEFPAVTHVALSVSDLDRSRPWYEALFGAPPVIDEDTGPFHHVVWLLGGQTLVGLHHFPDPHGTDPFDERRPGLDHRCVRLRQPRRTRAMGVQAQRVGHYKRRHR